MNTKENILFDVVDLCKASKYSDAIRNVNFQIVAHSNTAIIGETGSGKTTLLKLLAGLEQPDHGCIYYKGNRLVGPNECLIPGHTEIAFLSQHFELFNNYYVHEFLSYYNQYSEDDSSELFRLCKIDHLLNRKTNELSGGERQRIALAKQLISNPSVLLLDEPFSNLDAINKAIIKSILREVKQKFNITFLMVSHDANEVLPWADTVHVLKNGIIIQSDNPFNLYHQPMNTYCAALLGSYQLIDNFQQYPIWSHLSNFLQPKKFLFLRPEYLQIEKASQHSDSGEVKQIAFFGNYLLITLQYFDLELRSVTMNTEFAVGDHLQITYYSPIPWFL